MPQSNGVGEDLIRPVDLNERLRADVAEREEEMVIGASSLGQKRPASSFRSFVSEVCI